MATRKSNTRKIDRRTAAGIQPTRKDALALFNALHREGVSEDAAIDILGFTDEITDSAPSNSDPAHDRSRFIRYLLEGWQESDVHARRNVGEIIQRIRAGQSVDEIHRHFEQHREARKRKYEEELRNGPEPKNWLSPEWRYWKLRRIERAFESREPEGYAEARREYKALLADCTANENAYHVDFALMLLPHLICIRQDIARMIPSTPKDRRKPKYFKKRR